ncbi:MAG: hypothetical protein E7012_02905 [Alphaproteobacteria bacterium]|nr:hypothetical protein [Alphaproteobacteria bacterium]
MPKSINYLIISAIWSFITLSLRCINIIAGQISLSVTIFGLGLFIFYFLGGLPFAIGFSALCTGASSLSFYLKNRISPTVKLSEQGADSLGFLIGGFVILTIPEQSFPATAILLFFPFCEIIFALIQSLPFFNHGNKLRENTACFKACSTGLNCEIIDRIYFKIMIMTLFFGCFQLYAPASYSLWPICLVIVIWQQYRIIHWSTLSSGINDTNQKFVSNLNKQITSLKENFKQTDKKR